VKDAAKGPLSIALVTAYPPGRNSLNEFGQHLAVNIVQNDDVRDVIVLGDETEAGSPEWVDGIRVLPTWRFNALDNVRRVVRGVRRSRPDAVVFNLQFATFGDRKLPGALGLLAPVAVRYLTRTPVLVILHNLADNVDMRDAGFANSRFTATVMRLAGRLLTRALLAADLVAVTIPRYVEQLERNYGARNVLLAPHGSFQKSFVPTFETPTDPRRILAFGKWGTYKTVDVLIEAYEKLLADGLTDLELVIAGSDSPNSPGYMAGVAEKHGRLPGLVLTGYVAEEEVPELFRSAAVVAFPYTSTTGSSGVLHQAGEFGRAAVLPMIGDLIDIIEEEGFLGEYFIPEDANSLATALRRVLEDDALRMQMGRRNFLAAAGIPMSEVIDWHLIHLRRLIAQRRS
jgi:glycosyltransferase involved in cell wall biosynthesis